MLISYAFVSRLNYIYFVHSEPYFYMQRFLRRLFFLRKLFMLQFIEIKRPFVEMHFLGKGNNIMNAFLMSSRHAICSYISVLKCYWNYGKGARSVVPWESSIRRINPRIKGEKEEFSHTDDAKPRSMPRDERRVHYCCVNNQESKVQNGCSEYIPGATQHANFFSSFLVNHSFTSKSFWKEFFSKKLQFLFFMKCTWMFKVMLFTSKRTCYSS